MLKSEIKLKGGYPKLYVNGEETAAMAYTTYFEERSCCADFSKAGYRIFFVNASFTRLPINSCATGFSPFRIGIFEDNERPDYSEFEREVRRVIAACPDAIIFPRINVSMPSRWVDEHPDECVVTPKGGCREALFSEEFRRDASVMLRRFIEHVKRSDYAQRVGGWQICGGQTQEWFHHDLNGSIGKAAERLFPRYVKEKYGENAAMMPTRADFLYNGVQENENENAHRYVRFANEEVAKTVDTFAAVIKQETDYSQVVGTFYGYSFECCGTVLFGSHALTTLLDSPNLDFFSSPNAYTGNRAFGIDWADMIPVDSVKLHGKLCVFHATCGIDAGTNLEYNVVDGDRVLFEATDLDDRQQSLTGVLIEALEAEISQDSVLVRQRNDIRSDAHHNQIEQSLDLRERNVVAQGIRLHQFETYTTTRQLLERILAIVALGIEYRDRLGQMICGQVMVANDVVDTLLFGIGHLLGRFDAAIERDHKTHTLACCVVYTLDRHAITLVITVGNIETQVVVT